jgi:hypothetical protein
VPWAPEVFSASALAGVADRHRRERLELVPFFVGLMTGEVDAIIATFAGGQPEVHHPVRGRIRGPAAFERFAHETAAWLAERDAAVEDVGFIVTPRRRVEEVVLHLDGDEVPVAVAAEQAPHGAITELRVYFDVAGAIRPPLLQPDPVLVATDGLEALTHGLPEPLELCAVTDDGRACALEYNALARGRPTAGLAVRAGEEARIY